jgi:hypothetical protein
MRFAPVTTVINDAEPDPRCALAYSIVMNVRKLAPQDPPIFEQMCVQWEAKKTINKRKGGLRAVLSETCERLGWSCDNLRAFTFQRDGGEIIRLREGRVTLLKREIMRDARRVRFALGQTRKDTQELAGRDIGVAATNTYICCSKKQIAERPHLDRTDASLSWAIFSPSFPFPPPFPPRVSANPYVRDLFHTFSTLLFFLLLLLPLLLPFSSPPLLPLSCLPASAGLAPSCT